MMKKLILFTKIYKFGNIVLLLFDLEVCIIIQTSSENMQENKDNNFISKTSDSIRKIIDKINCKNTLSVLVIIIKEVHYLMTMMNIIIWKNSTL